MKNWMSVSVSVETENASTSDIQILQTVGANILVFANLNHAQNLETNKNTSHLCI
jgi:hypothetical protein